MAKKVISWRTMCGGCKNHFHVRMTFTGKYYYDYKDKECRLTKGPSSMKTCPRWRNLDSINEYMDKYRAAYVKKNRTGGK